MINQPTQRRYDLDWLRVLVILALIPFHAAVVFDVGSVFFVKNAASSAGLAVFTDSLGSWGMELLFFIAGASSWFALRKYHWRRYLRERVFRLLLPLGLGTLTVIPVMGYFGRLHHSGKHLSWFQYYPQFFTFDASRLDGVTGTFSPGHLWFILFLFVLMLIALPVWLALKTPRGERVTARLASLFSRSGAFLLMPVILLQFDGLPEIAERNVAAFFIFLLAGFIWMADPRLQASVDRQRFWLLAVSVITGAIYISLQSWGVNQTGFTLGATVFDLLHDIFAWTTVMTLLGFAHKYLNRPSRAIRYLGRASYPLYVIHLAPVIALAYYAVQWPASIAVKYLAIVLGSFIATFIIYELLIRRIRVVGYIFGIKATNNNTPSLPVEQ